VLFADLVGHTSFSEGRDAEDVRELLSRYFETARTVIERYGGAVEKFIGDAVMAVWGAPVAQEDDAERAVRRDSSSSMRFAHWAQKSEHPTYAPAPVCSRRRRQ
jgi:class 3 adenylate cyclase